MSGEVDWRVRLMAERMKADICRSFDACVYGQDDDPYKAADICSPSQLAERAVSAVLTPELSALLEAVLSYEPGPPGWQVKGTPAILEPAVRLRENLCPAGVSLRWVPQVETLKDEVTDHPKCGAPGPKHATCDLPANHPGPDHEGNGYDAWGPMYRVWEAKP